MSDFKFATQKILNTGADFAMRHAVFYPTFGRNWLSDGVPTALDKLRRLWHKKLVRLHREGLGIFTNRGYQYVRNCPPFGVATEQKARVCNKPAICPFCWARNYVAPAYDHVESLANAVPGAILVHFVRSRLFVPPSGRRWNSTRQELALHIARGIIKNHADRRAEVTALPDAVGGVVLHHVVPQESSLRLVRSGVIVLPPCSPAEAKAALLEGLGDIRPWELKVRVQRKVTRRSMILAVGWAFARPVETLDASPAALKAMLRVLKSGRMLTRYGPSPGVGEGEI